MNLKDLKDRIAAKLDLLAWEYQIELQTGVGTDKEPGVMFFISPYGVEVFKCGGGVGLKEANGQATSAAVDELIHARIMGLLGGVFDGILRGKLTARIPEGAVSIKEMEVAGNGTH